MVPASQAPMQRCMSRRVVRRRRCWRLLTACSEHLRRCSTAASRRPPAPAAAAGRDRHRRGQGRLILPLSAGGNAGTVALSMKNAAEMALAEFNSPNIQLLVKDDGGTSGGAQQAAQQALAEGAEIIIGPLFAHSVGVVGAAARQRGVPVIAFSTDASVAARGVYLLSFLPESDVDRIVDYAIANGKRSFAAHAVGGRLRQRGRGRIQAGGGAQGRPHRRARTLRARSGPDAGAGQARRAGVARRGRGVHSRRAGGGAVGGAGADRRPASTPSACSFSAPDCGTIRASSTTPRLQGGWYAAPDSTGFRNFSARYRQRYNQDPVRTATLAYDAVALVAALVKTQGPQRFSEQVLTSSSGFAGIDGLFRFRPDGTNERGLAVMRVSPTGGQIVSPPPRAFGALAAPDHAVYSAATSSSSLGLKL